ncbi:MAG: LicD family protein [Butyrivibrio sp.]|uniref:LicD family protein n=1 Tax=Butyrivibrio sp. TaxID=28121 RepID=UPI0025E9AAB6|nr:LicD family protein [Butyrivibrio sp.]MCR5773092.1 LicD family protein [Butyrivibrio sp.]
MKHSLDFFRDEVRNGFYIPTAVKQSWASSLDVLAEIDRICQKYNITYFADWGTFLGAVRHGGFVPWDDDIDICMKRDDYIRFREVADKELPSDYVIHNYKNQKNHWLFLSRVVDKSSFCFNEDYLEKHYNFPWLSGIDIFIKDYLYIDEKKEKERCDKILHILAHAEIDIGNCDIFAAIAKYEEAEKLMSAVTPSDSDTVGQIFPWILKGGRGEPKSYYDSVIRVPFEDTTIPIPSHYNELLSMRYENYNEVKKVWDGHAYPAFDNQRINFEKEIGEKLPSFSFSEALLKRASYLECFNKEKKVILFLPIGPKEWSGFHDIYEETSASPDTDVFVVPIPLLFKDFFGKIKMSEYEIKEATKIDEYPQDLPLYDWANLDLVTLSPDMIYIQSPYDNENPCLTVPEYFYSKNLQRYTKELIYIPISRTSEFTEKDITDQINLKFYVTMPGLFYSDKVILQSDNIKKQYIDTLVNFSGKDTYDYWNNKIYVST